MAVVRLLKSREGNLLKAGVWARNVGLVTLVVVLVVIFHPSKPAGELQLSIVNRYNRLKIDEHCPPEVSEAVAKNFSRIYREKPQWTRCPSHAWLEKLNGKNGMVCIPHIPAGGGHAPPPINVMSACCV